MPMMETWWRKRFGKQNVVALEEAMRKLGARLDPAAPWYFPILEYENEKTRVARVRLPARELSLPGLLTKTMLAFGSEFDAKSIASLDVCANVLRVTPDQGIRMRDLPGLTGLAKLGVADVLRMLGRQRLGSVQTDPSGSRSKIVMITSKARTARDNYLYLAGSIENDWNERFGENTLNQLRTALEEIVQGSNGGPSPLLQGLTPYPDGWRAKQPLLETLPHFPMVSHRGGFPDGS